MNNYTLSELENARKKMSGYIALLDFRYKNLCVKADIAALLPVTVYIDGQDGNIEEFANVNQPSDFQLGVYPKDPKDLQDIIQGIYEAHPEFKMEIKSTDGSEDEASKFLLYTMPEVDKNRYDFLTNAVKGLHDECNGRLDKIYAEYQAEFLKMLADLPPIESDEAKKALDEVNGKCRNMARDLLSEKQDEIEEGYQDYLKMMEEKRQEDAEIDFTKGFRIF